MLLKIAHLEVPVIEKPLGPDLMGEYDNGTATIFINDDLTTQLHKTTLFHESLHAISCIYGLELSENQVLILESAVLALIRDNPNVFN